jgi:response regulator RpfG family c-di-GMP phosphodiesterase
MSGIGGTSLLKKIRSIERFRGHSFLMILDEYNREDFIKALQTGADDIIVKPYSLESIYVKIKNLIRLNDQAETIRNLSAEVQSAREDTVKQVGNTYELLKTVLAMRMPGKDLELSRIHEACKYIAQQIIEDEKEAKDLLTATQFVHLGKFSLNDKFILNPVLIDGHIINDSMQQYPENVKKLMSLLEGAEDVTTLLLHIYENFDGTGIPEKLKSWKIPLGSRILRVAVDFEYLNTKNSGRESKVIDIMFEQINRLYDFRVLTFYDQYLAYKNSRPGLSGRALETSIEPKGLREDMILSRNIITSSGLKLLSSGTRLTDAHIERIQNVLATDSIIGKIWIKVF